MTGLSQGWMSLLPIPGLERLMGVVRACRRGDTGPFDLQPVGQRLGGSRCRALALCAERHGDGWGCDVADVDHMGTVGASIPFDAWPRCCAGLAFSGRWRDAGLFVFAVLFVWAVKVALIEPSALACPLQVSFQEIGGQTANAEWCGRLTQVSDTFRKLGEQALARGLHPPGRPAPD